MEITDVSFLRTTSNGQKISCKLSESYWISTLWIYLLPGKEGTGEKQALASTGKFTYCPSRSIVPGAPLFVQEQVGSWFGVLENNLCHIALLQTRRLMVFSTYWEWARWKPMLLRALTHEELLIMTEKVYWLIISLGYPIGLPSFQTPCNPFSNLLPSPL